MDPLKGKKVGGDYGSRRKVLSESSHQVARSAGQRHPQALASETHKKGAFGTNATYKQGKLSGAGSPYKRSLHHHLEAGTAPTQSSSAKPPSTKAILSFLDRIIADDQLSSQANIFKTVKEASKKQIG
ncbi:MAG: hypothetical protein A3I05_06370 [Deltaproteobacteria bacterium RIFCSPLOWO2_02_FULL_44_10]|nr:MAG: hypothetical protein A3C46_01655 [Deltaproteobacteria bacterium RIFCSPHIGHO2_02_FULL_44_16]OGQ46440.1 MAG: hypothetical protein A3I05_06370 [Deltaproteobacteria bacterium RIFCSPLOWO2_02_FULL_44_10]